MRAIRVGRCTRKTSRRRRRWSSMAGSSASKAPFWRGAWRCTASTTPAWSGRSSSTWPCWSWRSASTSAPTLPPCTWPMLATRRWPRTTPASSPAGAPGAAVNWSSNVYGCCNRVQFTDLRERKEKLLQAKVNVLAREHCNYALMNESVICAGDYRWRHDVCSVSFVKSGQ